MNAQKILPAILLGIVIVVVGYLLLNAPDRRDPGEKIVDAVQQLESRTPGEKLQDAVSDGKENVKESLDLDKK